MPQREVIFMADLEEIGRWKITSLRGNAYHKR
jgi:hypothetical protein